MSTSTPQLLITDAGLAAASIATPSGPYIQITGFQIGDGYGYAPQSSDTTINGNLLYQGSVLTYAYVGNNTLDITCQIPADAGPFNFGEIALMMPGNVMFAKAVFDVPQTKFSSLGSNVASTYTFNCLLELAQSVAVLQINNVQVSPAVLTVARWSDLYPPDQTANQSVSMMIIQEACPVTADASLVIQTSPTQWSMASTYKFFDAATVIDATLQYLEISNAALSNSALTTENNVYVVRTADGFYRSLASIVVSGSNYRLTFNDPLTNLPATNSTIDIYVAETSGNANASLQFVQQGSGFYQTSQTIQIGYGTSAVGGNLRLTVSGTDFGDKWPINVQGGAAFLYSGGTSAGAPMTFSASASAANPSYIWGGYNGSSFSLFDTASLSVNYATNAGTANTANNANNLGGQGPGYYQPALGFTPVQQGGGANQLTNKIHIGWASPGVLNLQIDNTDFEHTWPININGTAANGGVTSVNGLTGAVTVPTGDIKLLYYSYSANFNYQVFGDLSGNVIRVDIWGKTYCGFRGNSDAINNAVLISLPLPVFLRQIFDVQATISDIVSSNSSYVVQDNGSVSAANVSIPLYPASASFFLYSESDTWIDNVYWRVSAR